MITVSFRGIQLKLMSRNEFSKYLGISIQAYWKWLKKGIFLPPAYKDDNYLAHNFGREKAPRRYYIYQEAIEVRTIMQDYKFSRGRVINPEFADRVHAAMKEIRAKANVADASLMDYPLVLEFENIADLIEHMTMIGEQCKDLKELAQAFYLKGNKLLKGGSYAKQDRKPAGKKTSSKEDSKESGEETCKDSEETR